MAILTAGNGEFAPVSAISVPTVKLSGLAVVADASANDVAQVRIDRLRRDGPKIDDSGLSDNAPRAWPELGAGEVCRGVAAADSGALHHARSLGSCAENPHMTSAARLAQYPRHESFVRPCVSASRSTRLRLESVLLASIHRFIIDASFHFSSEVQRSRA